MEIEEYKGLAMSQMEADMLTIPSYQDLEGNFHAEKEMIVRGRYSTYRGDVLICEKKQRGKTCGYAVGLAELVDVKCVGDMTKEERAENGIMEGEYPPYMFCYMFRNPRRVERTPVVGRANLSNVQVQPLTVYPRYLEIGEKGWGIIMKKIKQSACIFKKNT